MTKIKGIERLEGRGITAKVTDTGKQFTTYQDFADAVGYPDAVNDITYIGGQNKARELRDREGEIFEVLANGEHGNPRYGNIYVIESRDGKRFLIAANGLNITFPDASPTDSLETRKDIEELIAEMRRQAYAEGYLQGFKQAAIDAEMEEQFRKVGEWTDNVIAPSRGDLLALGREVLAETPQEKRDRSVEEAKVDVRRMVEHGASFTGSSEGNITHRLKYYDVEFHVNKDKRTVVALVRGRNGRTLFEKGIAKCAPDDCFNAHIGRAIALRRALGLEVPDEYIYAPQPTEVRVGDVVEFVWNGVRETVKEFYPEYDGDSGKAFHTRETPGWVGTKQVKVVDDSREEADEEDDAS